MERLRVVLPLLLVLVMAGVATFPARGHTGFIIEGADEVNTLGLNTPPSTLGDLMDQIAHRFVIQHAHANRFRVLTPIPAELEALLGQLLPRFVLQFAKANRYIPLKYPVDLIDDDQPPQLASIRVAPAGDTCAIVSWTTDKYADSTVRCGTESGIYTMEVSDPLYVKAHALTLSGLTLGTTYYCRVSSTDLSGNTGESHEFAFKHVESFIIHLPLVMRSH